MDNDTKKMFNEAHDKISKLNKKSNNNITEEEMEVLLNWCYDYTSTNGNIIGESLRSILK